MTFAPAFDTGFGFLAFKAYNKNFTARIFGDGLGRYAHQGWVQWLDLRGQFHGYLLGR